MPDPDLENRGGGGGGPSRPLEKARSPPPNFFRPFGPQFGLKIRGVGGGGGRAHPLDPPLDSLVTADEKARTVSGREK